MIRIALLAAASTMATAAMAQPAPAGAVQQGPGAAANDGGIEEIVVTAQRRAENLQETPVAVTALSGEDLGSLQIERTQDIAKAVPNLQALPLTASPSSFQVALRGGSEQAGAIVTSEPAVAIYVDDVYRGRIAGSNFELSDIERIEVLRGPQGTLYGRNAFSGTIKIVTRKPGDESWVDLGAGYGSYDEFKLFGSAGGPVGSGIGASLTALYRDRTDGYIRNIALGRKVGAEESLAVRGAVNLHDAGPLEAYATLGYTRDRNDGYSAIPVTFPDPSVRPLFSGDAIPLAGCKLCNQSPTVPLGRNDQWAATLNAAYDLGGITLRSITGYIDTEDFFRWDLSGGTRTPAGTFVAGFQRAADANSRQFSQELQALGDTLDGRLEYIVGLFYFWEKSRQVFNDIFGFPLLPTTLRTRTSSYAAFAQATFDLSDRLSATTGLRYTRDDKSLDATIQSGFAPPVSLVPVARDDKFDSWTPKFGIDFEATDDLFLYVSVSRGFKAGGYNGLAVASPLVLSSVYEPQTIWAYEVGAKLTALDNRLRANLALFRNDLSDLQQTANIAPFSFAVQNVGDARVTGAELEVTYVPVEGLTLFGNLGLMDDDYKRLSPTSEAAINNATRLPLVSRYTYQVGFSYDGIDFGPVRLKFGADYKKFGDYLANVNNTVRIDGFQRLDGFVAVATADDRWELSLQGKNLTDEEDYGSAAQAIALTPNLPRIWLLQLRYRL
jgi:iron complex outermembrane recepter protein